MVCSFNAASRNLPLVRYPKINPNSNENAHDNHEYESRKKYS